MLLLCIELYFLIYILQITLFIQEVTLNKSVMTANGYFELRNIIIITVSLSIISSYLKVTYFSKLLLIHPGSFRI